MQQGCIARFFCAVVTLSLVLVHVNLGAANARPTTPACSSVGCPTPTATPTPVSCVETGLCIRGFHWSPERCACVPDHSHLPRAPHVPHPPHVPHRQQSADQRCRDSGGTVTSALCCASASDFPNTCLIGACGCAPDASHQVSVCDCGDASCFDDASCTRRQ